MKKFIMTALALAAIPIAALAQNRAIEELATKYSNREGYTVVSLKGEMVKYVGSAVDVSKVNISDLMDDISSIIVITGERPDKGFREEVDKAVAAGKYWTLMSVSDSGQYIRFLLAPAGEAKKGEPRRNEFVMVVLSPDENVLISIVGKYKAKQISKSGNGEAQEQSDREDGAE